MSNRFSQSKPWSQLSHRLASFLKPSLGKGIGVVIVLALGCGVLLLVNDVPWPIFTPLAHAPISALPLLLIGLAALGFQLVIRPKLLDLFKACIVSSAFLLWGVDQLLPTGWLATTLGDVVIVLYVIDLGWMMLDRLNQQGMSQQVLEEKASPSPRMHDHDDSPTQPLHMLPAPPPFPPVPEQAKHSSAVLKRTRLLPLLKTPQERQPSV